MTTLWLDTETFSDVALKHGVNRYAERAEVIITALAVDDGPVEVFDGLDGPFVQSLVDQADEIVIHNSRFDRTVLTACGVTIPVEKIHDTLAQARSVGLPGALGTLSEIFGLPADKAKDKEGRQLINLFCKPRPKNMKERRATARTHPAEWQRFRAYAALDIESMRAIRPQLPMWNYRGAERQLWETDQLINDRGFAVDLGLASAALETVAREQKRLGDRTVELTDGEVESTQQRDALLRHLLEAYGVSLPDMQKGTLERRLVDENLPGEARELIAIRLEASSTSVAKYRSLVDATCADGRLRGALEFCGAARTGRWSGRLFQPQNLPRTPDWFDAEEQAATVEAIKTDTLDLLVGDPIKRASYAIRGAIVAPEGKKLVVADLANIEGRVLAWLAGEEWKLDAFRAYDAGTGPDLYLVTAGNILGKKPDAVTKAERQSTGKVPELACGYQGAVGAFSSMARIYGLDLPEHEVLRIVRGWRERNPNIVRLWYDLEDAAISAARTPGVTVSIGRLRLRRDGNWLRLGLPSGRALCYPSPKVSDGRLSYMGMNQYSRKWERIDTYGGKLAENATQAVARDVLACGMLAAEEAGYEIVLSVHDELVAEVADEARFTAAGLIEIMIDNPPWADGLPLAADGEEMRRYRK